MTTEDETDIGLDNLKGRTPGERLVQALGLGPEWVAPADEVIAEERVRRSKALHPSNQGAIRIPNSEPKGRMVPIIGSARLIEEPPLDLLDRAFPFPPQPDTDWRMSCPITMAGSARKRLRAEPIDLTGSRPRREPGWPGWRTARRWVRAALKMAPRTPETP